MTGFLITAAGEIWQLPPLLYHDILRTDGCACDSVRLRFIYEPARLDVLKDAIEVKLTENGQTRFYGVVDDIRLTVSPEGRVAELSGRGLMARMTDCQLRGAEYARFYEKDAVRDLAHFSGVMQVVPGNLPPLRSFCWGSGTSAWKALEGYCRHSGNVRPRFAADGTLHLAPAPGALWQLQEPFPFQALCLSVQRYGIVTQQTMLTAKGQALRTDNPHPMARHGTCRRVDTQTGNTLKATWRSADQRIDDSMEDALILEMTLPGDHAAQPGDQFRISLNNAGISGLYHLRSIRTVCGADGRYTKLELKEAES